ncbi:hypothetical protein M0811_05709 [Anaeramoeba ignava]|uniref:Uncharacterized protein n=1 Tax=Anaeramoeba ignava TaxID=1746090 RepID=A0A9Q0LTH1_ANAIG|nr:hypothetical protein M0811_05709 [Anaeramoeba ignava]
MEMEMEMLNLLDQITSSKPLHSKIAFQKLLSFLSQNDFDSKIHLITQKISCLIQEPIFSTKYLTKLFEKILEKDIKNKKYIQWLINDVSKSRNENAKNCLISLLKNDKKSIFVDNLDFSSLETVNIEEIIGKFIRNFLKSMQKDSSHKNLIEIIDKIESEKPNIFDHLQNPNSFLVFQFLFIKQKQDENNYIFLQNLILELFKRKYIDFWALNFLDSTLFLQIKNFQIKTQFDHQKSNEKIENQKIFSKIYDMQNLEKKKIDKTKKRKQSNDIN